MIKISSVLNSCKSQTVDEINRYTAELQTKHTSLFFLNIDGNKTNFDTLSVELNRYKYKQSIIGLAETNTEQGLGDLYQLPEYRSFYQDTIQNKISGTGVALYVHNTMNATVFDDVSNISPNLETLFVNISSKTVGASSHTTIGVVYRPPSGDFDQSMIELA